MASQPIYFQRAMAQQQTKNARTGAGRYEDPTKEIGRLLDELERQRNALSQISIDPTLKDMDLQRRIQEATLRPALAQISGDFGSRGLSGSSLEAVQRATMAGQIGLQSQQIMNQQAQEQAFRRGEFELGRNRQLFESLTGGITATTTRGAPGTQVKKKGGGILGAIGGIAGGILGSAIPGIGTAIGGAVGSRIGGYISGNRDNGQIYEDPYNAYQNVG